MNKTETAAIIIGTGGLCSQTIDCNVCPAAHIMFNKTGNCTISLSQALTAAKEYERRNNAIL